LPDYADALYNVVGYWQMTKEGL